MIYNEQYMLKLYIFKYSYNIHIFSWHVNCVINYFTWTTLSAFEGDAPVIGNLPVTIYVNPTAAINDVIFNVDFSDANTKQTLTPTMTITPNVANFNIDVATGKSVR